MAVFATIDPNQDNGVIDLYKATIDDEMPQKIVSIHEHFGNAPKKLNDWIEDYKLIEIKERAMI